MRAGFIKLCGLFRSIDAEGANAAAPDYAGLVFHPPSPRYVCKKEALEIRHLLHPAIQTVGVFVDAPLRKISSLYQVGLFQVIQLHGKEDKAYLQSLRRELPEVEIWQSFSILEPRNLLQASESQADRLLLDSGKGSGHPFDWSLLERFSQPFILAGGLTPDNLALAIHRTSPLGVDLSSGIETNGLKDPKKMAEVTSIARAAFVKNSLPFFNKS